jgi:hypothetical protein
MNYVNKLKVLAAGLTFVERPTANDWISFEQTIHAPLPDDFKELVEHFGSGKFGGNLYLFNPVDLSLTAEQLIEYGRYAKEGAIRNSVPFYPDRGGMVLISHNGSGDDFHYFPVKRGWDLIVYEHDSENIIRVPYTLSEFIYRSRIRDIDDSLVEFARCIWPNQEAGPVFVPKVLR